MTAAAFFVLAFAAYVGAITAKDAMYAGGALSFSASALLIPGMMMGRMENLADMGNIGDIGGIVGSVIALGVAAIILLTFSVPIIGDVDGIAVQSKSSGHCLYNGERFDRLVKAGSHTTADAAWASVKTTSANKVDVTDSSGACVVAAATYFTPKGTKITLGTANIASSTTSGWKAQSASLGALSGGSLIGLLFGAMGILIPAGALGGLAYFGAQMVQKNIGGNTLAIAIGATVSVIIVASILPELFAPLDVLFVALDGNRFYVYSQGIGKIASVLGNFLGIALVGGLIGLGAMLWKGARRGGSRMEMM